jgi:hypothetical protein
MLYNRWEKINISSIHLQEGLRLFYCDVRLFKKSEAFLKDLKRNEGFSSNVRHFEQF